MITINNGSEMGEGPGLSFNGLEVLKRRYLLKDDRQKVVETPEGLFRRVSRHIARAERNFKFGLRAEEAEEAFYGIMSHLEFLPNSPTLMNAGTSMGQLSACFVLPVEDSIGAIFDALKDMAKVHQTGGGTGFSFSRLRPKNDLVYSTKGSASGPVSFMKIFDAATGVIVQGGRRRGANMGVLRCDHPDIVEFVEAKREKTAFSNFNLSVGVTDSFMEAVKTNSPFDLINPRTRRRTGAINARELFDLISSAAWHTGDPGLIFLDEVNRKNPTPAVGEIEATNPCGELPLIAYESCNLGSINLSKMVRGGRPDWDKLRNITHLGVRFLDDVVEMNKYPLPEIKKITIANRKIGLGVMGFADMLIKLGIPYDSKGAAAFAASLMAFVHKESVSASHNLAKERRPFSNHRRSIYFKKGLRLRNATVNTIAPTGTISIIASCSSGIEPIFAISFMRNVLSGERLFEVNTEFESVARRESIYGEPLLKKIAKRGSLRGLKEVPLRIRRVFPTAFDVTPRQHLLVQASFQRHTDNSVSKTINLPSDATVEEVRDIYMTAYKLRLKGVTVYRYGSKGDQVLSFDYAHAKRPSASMEPVVAESEYSGGCASGVCPF